MLRDAIPWATAATAVIRSILFGECISNNDVTAVGWCIVAITTVTNGVATTLGLNNFDDGEVMFFNHFVCNYRSNSFVSHLLLRWRKILGGLQNGLHTGRLRKIWGGLQNGLRKQRR
jgi:hypothetical protein